jgi:shikimate kinase
MSSLWLIGMMGAGKTTIGRLVATIAERPFIDLDGAVEATAGRSVQQIFVDDGESAFRDLETIAVSSVAGKDAVVACGGGVVLRPENRSAMRDRGLVVWLQARLETLAERLEGAENRPLLRGPDVTGSLAFLENERIEAYRETAHHAVSTDGRSPVDVAEEVMRLWR